MGTRARVLCTAVILLGLSMASSLGQTGPEPPDLAFEAAQPSPDVARLRAEIADKLAKLNIPAHPAETPSVKATEGRKAIEQGRFAAARQIIATMLASSKMQPWRFYPFESFIIDVPDNHSATFQKKVDDWVAHAAGDPIPLLVRAQYYYNVAWIKRGPDFVSMTPSDNLDAYSDYMTRALKDIDAAIKLDHTNPYSYCLKLSMLSDMGRLNDAKAWFEGSVAAYPNFFTLYYSMLGALTPKWGGSTQAMYRFVDYYAGQAPEHSPLKMLYLALYTYLLDDAGVSCSDDAAKDSDILAPCIAIHMKKTMTPELDGHVQEALQLYDRYDHQEYNFILRTILHAMQPTGGATLVDSLLQRAAAATHSSIELPGKEQGHNDYVIDELAAGIGRHKLLFDNSIEKMKEALLELDAIKFTNPGEKAGEMAYIYNQLAMYSDLKSEYLFRSRQRTNLDETYVDMIVYETAAAKLSKSARNQHLACYGYAHLQLYEDVIRACSDVLADDDDVQAHYWRGIGYRHTNQLPQALRDLGFVADSGDRQWRPYAVVQMSYIYLGMKDYKSLLDVIDAHRFLFGPMWDGFAYETRCRAYMELGDLQKALADCTAALRINSSPQALRLQQELMDRLAGKKPTEAALPPPPAQSAAAPSDAQDRYPHLSSQLADDIKAKVSKAGFEPNGIAIVYDVKDWHQQFPADHPYAKMLDLPMPSLKAAVEVMAHFAQDGLGFAAPVNRPPRFHVMLVDDRDRRLDDRVLDKHVWGSLGISMVQAHSPAEMQKNIGEAAPDVMLIADALPEAMKSAIQSQVRNLPTVIVRIPTPGRAEEEAAYLAFEEVVFDALQRTIPADKPVYVSFVTR